MDNENTWRHFFNRLAVDKTQAFAYGQEVLCDVCVFCDAHSKMHTFCSIKVLS